MKYSLGDWLAVRTPDGDHLVVYVAGIRGPQYDLALIDYCKKEAPAAGELDDCSFFAVEMETEDSSFSGLDVVVMGEKYVNGSDDIRWIRQWALPDYMGLSGLERMGDIGALADHFKKELACRQRPRVPEQGSPSTISLKKYRISPDEIFRGAPQPNPFPAVKLYRMEGEVVLAWQIYGSTDPLMVVINEGQSGELWEYQIKDKNIEELEEEYVALIREKRAEGYLELYLLL
jgi:hypothetical protein